MTENQPTESNQSTRGTYRPLRVWPVIFLLAAMAVRWIPKIIAAPSDNMLMVSMLGPVVLSLLILIWWISFSRSRWHERLAGFIGVVIAGVVVGILCHKSMLGIGTAFLTVPMGMAAFGVGAILFRNTLSYKRTVIAVLMATIGFAFSTSLRNEGMWSDSKMAFRWRWTPTLEDELLAAKRDQPTPDVAISADVAAALLSPEWPGFRGADRTGRQRGSKFSAQWSESPAPVWKIAAGPSWSSFAVAGDLLFTQEQRGENEVVVCYDALTGDERWIYEVKTRFDESIGGPGPRATPTIANIAVSDGQLQPALFALGANGTLMRLDPTTGEKVWQTDLDKVANRKPPTWGYSSSPLVVDSNVIVHAGGPDDKGLLAFDTATGDVAWSVKSGDHSYSSPQLSTVLGEDLVLMLTNKGFQIVNPADGKLRLDYEWDVQGYRALQPLMVGEDRVILGTGVGTGTRLIRLSISDGSEALTAEEIWTTNQLKPDFNDFVMFEGHLYGFDASIFTCIDSETGKRVWKGGRYGKGQVLLLEDSGLLLVAAENGEVVILKADPTDHIEMGRFQAIEGKTWNHPVVVGDRLFIRNGQEAACYRMPVEGDMQITTRTQSQQ